MAPNPPRLVTPEHQAALRDALAARDRAEAQLHAAVLAALQDGCSVREVARFTGLAPATIQRWKQRHAAAYDAGQSDDED